MSRTSDLVPRRLVPQPASLVLYYMVCIVHEFGGRHSECQLEAQEPEGVG